MAKKRKSKKRKAIKKTERKTPEIILDKFYQELLKNGGDATKAAMSVFNYGIEREWQASAVGSKLLQELGPRKDELIRAKFEKEAGGIDFMVKELKKKIKTTSKTDWWDRGMKIAGYGDFLNKPSNINININKAHKDYTNKYIEGEIVETKEEA